MVVLIQLLEIIPSIMWIIFCFWLLYSFRDSIKQLFPWLSRVKFGKLEIEFYPAMLDASSKAEKFNRIKIKSNTNLISISKKSQLRSLKRALRCSAYINHPRILWIDDSPSNNTSEIELLTILNSEVTQVRSTAEAFHILESSLPNEIDIIISDIDRPNDSSQSPKRPAGIYFMDMLSSETNTTQIPVIFYIGLIDRSKQIPLGAFGITNRPDELLHLVLDALERTI